MRYITFMGELYRVSERNYQRFLRSVIAGDDSFSIDKAGKLLGTVENLTDLEPSWAETLLEDARRKKV